MSRPTMSRWGRSAYDTDEAWAAEADTLAPLVRVLAPGSDADVIVVNSKTRVDASLLEQLPSVRLVITSTSGYEHLDLESVRAVGARAARLPLVRRDAVVEASLELMLTGIRQTGRLAEDARQDRWSRGRLPHLPIRTLRGARVGLVGLGVIGREMARVLQALGAEVFGADPRGVCDGVVEASVPELLGTCDVVSLHAASSDTSRGMLGGPALEAARPGLVLLNTARGDLLDVDAAYEAVVSGRLGFLGVDVFPEEPWPRLAAQARHPAVVFTPHSAGWHAGLPEAVTQGLAETIAAFCHDAPLPHSL